MVLLPVGQRSPGEPQPSLKYYALLLTLRNNASGEWRFLVGHSIPGSFFRARRSILRRRDSCEPRFRCVEDLRKTPAAGIAPPANIHAKGGYRTDARPSPRGLSLSTPRPLPPTSKYGKNQSLSFIERLLSSLRYCFMVSELFPFPFPRFTRFLCPSRVGFESLSPPSPLPPPSRRLLREDLKVSIRESIFPRVLDDDGKLRFPYKLPGKSCYQEWKVGKFLCEMIFSRNVPLSAGLGPGGRMLFI